MSTNSSDYQKSQNIKYQSPAAVRDKWIRINKNINKYTDASTLLQSIREAFILVECVMSNTLQDYKKNYISYGVEVPGERNTYTFHYETGDITINFSDKSAFAMSRALVALGYRLPTELDDTRRLRNFVSHNLETTTVDYFKENMNYDIVVNSIQYLGQSLVALNMLTEADIKPDFNSLRAKEGETVGLSHEFTIERFIAKSGTSRLYEGRHNRLNVRVAIKELLPKTYSEGLLMQERDLLVSLSHPQVPRIYDVFNQNGTFYIVMDYIDGVGLDEYAKKKTPVSERIRIIADVCEVMNYLHDKKQMVHTDLKPQNIMIDTEGVVHIIDFGTAMNKYDTPELLSVSAGYTAPEVIDGRAVDYRIDIYSIGAIIKFLFKDEIENLPNKYDDVIANIKRIAERCMQHDPYARYNNVIEIKNELYQLTEVKPVSAKKASRPKKKINIGQVIVYTLLIITTIVSLVIKIADYKRKNKNDSQNNTTATTSEQQVNPNSPQGNVSDEDALAEFKVLEEKAWKCLVAGNEQGYIDLFRCDANSEASLRDSFRRNYQNMQDIYNDCDYVLLCNEGGLCFGSATRTLVSEDGSYIRKEFTYPFSCKDGEWKFDVTPETSVVTENKYKENVYAALPGSFNDARTTGRNYALLCDNNYIWMDSTLVYEGIVDASIIAASQMMDGSVEFVVSIKNGTNKEANIKACTVNLTTVDGNAIVTNYRADVSAVVKSSTSILITFIVPKDSVQNISAVWGNMHGSITAE